MRQDKIVIRVSRTHVGETDTHDKYLYMPKSWDMEYFFGNGSKVLLEFTDISDNEKMVLTYNYYLNSKGKEKRLTGIWEYIKKHNLQAGEVVVLSKNEIDDSVLYTINCIQNENSIVFQKVKSLGGFICLNNEKLSKLLNEDKFERESELSNNILVEKINVDHDISGNIYSLHRDSVNLFDIAKDDDMIEFIDLGHYGELAKVEKYKYIKDAVVDKENENFEDDQDIISRIGTTLIEKDKYEYKAEPVKKKSLKVGKDSSKKFPRDMDAVENSLARAEYKCEYDPEHKLFIRRSDHKSYTEPHHLIPLKYYDDFEYSIDIPANIVSLCSSCHNQIHYGIGAELLIERLWNERKDELKKAKIGVTLKKLLSYYGF